MLTIQKGMRTDADGRIRTTYTHNPSTLRLSSAAPNLQNIPRGGGNEVQRWVKDIFEAPAGHTFIEADFSAIEAVLVGYFGGSQRYSRFAKLGVHAYMAAQLVGQKIDLTLPDAEIKAIFKGLKKEHEDEYNTAKRVVHLSNYLGTPKRMQEEYPETFPTIKKAAELQELYFDLFPEIPTWHKTLCEQVDGTRRRQLVDGETPEPWTLGVAWAQNPFGYLHRFYHVLDWEKIEGEWFPTFGDDAKRLIAFLPQSTASAILKRAASSLWYDEPEVAPLMRLLVHDSIVLEVPESQVDSVVEKVHNVMTRPVPELPLDPAWGMGESMTVGVEVKMGKVWSEMRVIK